MRVAIILTLFIALAPLDAAFAQLAGTGDFHIVWEVKNRFRLFRNEADFLRQVAASRGDGVLAAERRLERDTDGLGWAKDAVANLCLDNSGELLETCERDGERESYLSPRDHPIGVTISGPVPQDATCAWNFDDGDGPVRQKTAPCDQEVKLRVRYGRTTVATVDIPLGDGTAQRVVTEIAVRDVLIAGIGDSIAAGEGNPDKTVELEGGFCFRRFLRGGGSQYFRPSRAGYSDDRSCENGPSSATAAQEWARHGARWMNPACHRSLYSYQVRTALALAIEQPHLAVTLIPLACTGATIGAGMFAGQRADDCPWVVGIERCSGTAPAQFAELKDIMAAVHRQQPNRNLDMVLLTVGANDVNFAALVANVIVDATTERLLLRQGGAIASVADSQKALDADLPGEFAQLRSALKPYVGGNLERVVFVSYANPAMQAENKPCSGSRNGLDVHPAFGADSERLRAAAEFVDTKFLPKLKMLATCDGNKICRDPTTERMTFVDAHQAQFARHGMCVRAADDPEFDRNCFSPNGDSFQTDPTIAPDDPMVCSEPASDYRPYAPRARWIRTANDSYFTAMTYPEGMPAILKPSDIHDALWGVLSAVYGGAVHPTAEGYAAMTDAALPAARGVLGLSAPPAVQTEPLPLPTEPAPAAPPAAGATPSRAP
jgi:lysophospholipase L1-like esterase